MTNDFFEVRLSRGLVALVSNSSKHLVENKRWFALKAKVGFYAARNIRREDGKWTLELMHRVIAGANSSEMVDHKNHDPLDNRLDNLRLCTHSQNMRNLRKQKNRSSKFKGVTAKKTTSHAAIYKDGRTIHLGSYPNEQLAARAYDRAAGELYGEWALTNSDMNLYSEAI